MTLRAGYTGGQPTSAAAIALADEGYYALACRAHGDRIFDILEPYKVGSLALGCCKQCKLTPPGSTVLGVDACTIT